MNQDNLQPINDLQPIRGLNFVELTPISFLKRAADTYAERPAVLYGERRGRQTRAGRVGGVGENENSAGEFAHRHRHRRRTSAAER